MNVRKPLHPLFLLEDEPIEGHDGDFLDREDDARAIAGAVLGTTGPFSVGVYGEWGTGKTSLLHHVKSLLEAKDPASEKHLMYPYVVTVLFNAWQYEQDEEPLAHLAEAVDAAIAQRLAEVASPVDAATRKAVAWLRSAHLAARSLVYATSVESRLDPTDELVGRRGWQFWKWSPFFKFSAKDAIDRHEKLQKEAANPESKAWKSHVDQSVARSVIRSFRANHKLLDKVRPGEERRIPRVVIFIDDMDRCLPEDAFKLLQAIKLAVAQPGFVFVMTLDPVALRPFLENKVGEAGLASSAGSKAIYLDKLVQLPLRLRLHDDQFQKYVDRIVNERLKEMLPESQWKVFSSLAKALQVCSQRNPRTLVRRINGLLVDARIAPHSIKKTLDADETKAEGIFMGLCLVRDSLKQFVGEAETKQLSERQPLCTLIMERGLTRCYNRMAGVTGGNMNAERMSPALEGQASGNEPGDTELMQGRELLLELNRRVWLDDLFRTDAGQRWLASKADRDLVETFFVKRPEEPKLEQVATPATAEYGNIAGVAKGSSRATASTEDSKPNTQAALWQFERALIERAIRARLELPADATVGPAECANVTALNLMGDQVTDAATSWLADTATGFKALTKLELCGTQVTDAGVRELARAETGLKALSTLDLSSTQVSDAGLKELSRADTGLKALTTLNLFNTQVTDAGLKELSRADTGLKALTTLALGGKQVTDAGVKQLARPETGIRALTTLDLRGTQVTDAGVKELARAETGLKALTTLDLMYTMVTDAGVEELARSETGLKALTTLDLSGTQVTDAGVQALTRAETGLKALTTLNLYHTRVTDAGVHSLARAETGVKALSELDLNDTQVTDEGMQALARAETGLKALTTLDLSNTHVTDAGVQALARAETGLKYLSTLRLRFTKVTDAGVRAVRERWPGIRVIR